MNDFELCLNSELWIHDLLEILGQNNMFKVMLSVRSSYIS